MESLIPINIVIGDRNYRIKVAPEHEEHVRKTLHVINEKIVEFKTQFAGKDMQDYVAMVLVWYATQAGAAQQNAPSQWDKARLEEALQKMNEQLTKALQS
ncbi:MAG: cell division protein ZapA [Lacibacter sp.]|jgi:cell division protein ZapA